MGEEVDKCFFWCLPFLKVFQDMKGINHLLSMFMWGRGWKCGGSWFKINKQEALTFLAIIIKIMTNEKYDSVKIDRLLQTLILLTGLIFTLSYDSLSSYDSALKGDLYLSIFFFFIMAIFAYSNMGDTFIGVQIAVFIFISTTFSSILIVYFLAQSSLNLLPINSIRLIFIGLSTVLLLSFLTNEDFFTGKQESKRGVKEKLSALFDLIIVMIAFWYSYQNYGLTQNAYYLISQGSASSDLITHNSTLIIQNSTVFLENCTYNLTETVKEVFPLFAFTPCTKP